MAALELDGPVIEVGGVGLGLRASATTMRRLPAVGGEASLLTHLVVREEALDLYGFATASERGLFEALVSVSGVGPRMALAVCSLDDADDLRLAIARGDAARLQAAAGIGRRTAERIVLELRERIGAAGSAGTGPAAAEVDGIAAAREGLLGLGFRPEETEAALRDAPGGLDAEALLRHALEALRRR